MELKKDSSPPVYRTILNMELPKWAKHQALKDIEQMSKKEAWSKNGINPEIDDLFFAFEWRCSNSGYAFWYDIHKKQVNIRPPNKWLIPNNLIPDELKTKTGIKTINSPKKGTRADEGKYFVINPTSPTPKETVGWTNSGTIEGIPFRKTRKNIKIQTDKEAHILLTKKRKTL